MTQRALIFGVTGQDGALLSQHLLTQGFEVHGTSRRHGDVAGNLRQLGIADRVRIHQVDPLDGAQVAAALSAIDPSQAYNLSGQSSVGRSFAEPRDTFDSHVGSTLTILEAIRTQVPACRFFHASSSEIFGDTTEQPANEASVPKPYSPYGVAKAAATLLVKSYRDLFGLFVCSGFMFNHESPLRPDSFVTQRIVHGAAAIKLNRADRLTLGNLKIVRDWGWAEDYVECMARMLEQDEPHDYVVATGVASSLESFVDRVFSRFDLDWKDFVVVDDQLLRPNDISVSVGDPRLAEQRLGWRARVRMPEVAERLADAALARARG